MKYLRVKPQILKKMTEKEERRMKFLQEDKEMFGLTPSEEAELKQLRSKVQQLQQNGTIINKKI